MSISINQYHGEYNTQSRNGTKVSYIVVHYVGDGDSTPGSAKRNCIYFSRGDRQASAHYFIDDGGIWEYCSPDRATWHCGDGHGKYGITNSNSIGIEVCNNGGPFTFEEIGYLQQLVMKLMVDYGINASHVVRHYDASRKECPVYYVENPGEWEKLRDYISGSGSKPATKPEKLDEDGWFGTKTIMAAQAVLGTPVDGVVSAQNIYDMNAIGGRPTNCWVIGKGGSQMVAALQRMLGVKDDGYFGPETCKAFQRRFGTSVDGVISHPSAAVKGFQEWLNSQA